MLKLFKMVKKVRNIVKKEDSNFKFSIQNIKISIKKIKILGTYEEKKPTSKKLADKENYYLTIGKFKENIVINRDNYLVDGYTTYLLALKYGIKQIKVIKNMKY